MKKTCGPQPHHLPRPSAQLHPLPKTQSYFSAEEVNVTKALPCGEHLAHAMRVSHVSHVKPRSRRSLESPTWDMVPFPSVEALDLGPHYEGHACHSRHGAPMYPRTTPRRQFSEHVAFSSYDPTQGRLSSHVLLLMHCNVQKRAPMLHISFPCELISFANDGLKLHSFH